MPYYEAIFTGVDAFKAQAANVPWFKQHFLYFFPLPQGQGSFLPIFRWLGGGVEVDLA